MLMLAILVLLLVLMVGLGIIYLRQCEEMDRLQRWAAGREREWARRGCSFYGRGGLAAARRGFVSEVLDDG